MLDTGLAAGFPQLSTAPGNWFDPYDEHKTPFDEDAHGHGTEVAEIVASMAPDVRVIAARVFSDGGRSTTSAVHRVFEWVLDPDGNPKTDDAPSVINGSWDDGQPGRCETEFDSDIAALRAAGIVPVFAAGNAGPAAATGASPASAPSAVAVGSVSQSDIVSPFSGRGPSPCGNAVYPTLAAYGEGIAIEGPGGSATVRARRSPHRRSPAPSRCSRACSPARPRTRSSTPSCAARATSGLPAPTPTPAPASSTSSRPPRCWPAPTTRARA